MLVVGLPFITSLIGLVAGYVLVNGLVTRAWNRMRTDVEAEIPTLLSGLKSAISTAPNVPQALADTARTLRAGGPLRSWAEKLPRRCTPKDSRASRASARRPPRSLRPWLCVWS